MCSSLRLWEGTDESASKYSDRDDRRRQTERDPSEVQRRSSPPRLCHGHDYCFRVSTTSLGTLVAILTLCSHSSHEIRMHCTQQASTISQECSRRSTINSPFQLLSLTSCRSIRRPLQSHAGCNKCPEASHPGT